eukprot:TRINITY_DN24057_c0_g1_i1.p1 TRINITY_DN24057_c0_g1~~TRINITY_DN24057_c0_g1_i1.p1  ORF type:complete len:473 (+),score=163.37 TRINITY_DN24057_c0_g1_i1:43-1461(+)
MSEASHNVPKSKGVAIIFAVLQVTIILLYAFTTEYGDDTKHSTQAAVANQVTSNLDSKTIGVYPFYQDVHVMVFVGFGFLMTFLKKYSMSAVGFNMLIASFMLQWTILALGFWHRAFKIGGHGFYDRIQINVADLVPADFGAATVLITFGALLGKAGPCQLVVLGFWEIFLYGLNESIGVNEFRAVDMGGSMYVHMFGAFFGIGASYTFMSAKTVAEKDKRGLAGSTRTTDTIAMVGTLFLWMFWPSFNGALAVGAARNRVIINTVLSIAASCTSAFLFSYLLRNSGKFSMVDIQNATLAGGVAVGTSSDIITEAWPALLIGMIAGGLSVAGYVYVQPALESFGLHDTCGVLNLHGLPGVLAAVAGAIAAASADETVYGQDVGGVFAARVDKGRSASHQGGMQVACMFTTLGISLAGGLIGGFLIRYVPDLPENESNTVFEDGKYWEIEDEEAPEILEQAVTKEEVTEPIVN